jgi:hydrogenase maturation protease
MQTILILGIGNNLLTDEGVGVHVVDYLARHFPRQPGIDYLDGGTLSFTLADPIAAHDHLIVVDAARLGEAPGTVRCLHGDEMDRYLVGNRASVHEVGLTDLLDIARLSGTLPVNRALVGVEPAALGWGDSPSPAVAPAVAEAARVALELARAWRDA